MESTITHQKEAQEQSEQEFDLSPFNHQVKQ